jgi:large subunit ribosomal protein L15
MPHKLRKIRKHRGSRTQGYGQVGQHRKRGTKGYRKAGRHKQGWTYTVKYDPEYFGKKGFTPRGLSRKTKVINVGELGELAENFSAKKKNGKLLLDLKKLGYDKLLGMGRITSPITVKVASFSETAAKKMDEAGGQIIKEPPEE